MPRGNLAIGLIWAYFIGWILSAFVHMSDPDVDGIGGLTRARTIASVSALAVILMSPMAACQIFWRMRRYKSMLLVWGIAAVVIGGIVGVWGGGSVSDSGGGSSALQSMGGGILVIAIVIIVGCLPMWVGKGKKDEDKN